MQKVKEILGLSPGYEDDEEYQVQSIEHRELSMDDKINIEKTLVNMENEIAYVRSLLKGQQFIRKPERKPKLNKLITNNMLLFTVIWQMVLLISVAFCELIFSDEKAILNVAITLGSVIQFVQVCFVIITSVKLVKQLRHRTASGWFLVQSYMSIIILFAGAYTLVFQIEPDSFHSAQLVNESSEIFAIYTIFLYFSGTTMSTVGYGDIFPVVWYTQLMVLFEAILSVVFTTVIFVKGLSHFGGQLAAIKNDDAKNLAPDTPLTSYGSTTN